MLTLHRTYSGLAKEPVFYIGDAGKAKELKGAKSRDFLSKLKKGTKLLSTSAHSSDAILLQLAKQGVKLYAAHWHTTGIEKGLPPEEIAAKFSALPETTLRAFVARPDLASLRAQVSTRNAVIDFRKAVMNQLGAAARNLGISEDRLPKWLSTEVDAAKEDAKAVEPKVEKLLITEAKKIDECKIFNKVFGMKEGWVVAGQFVSRVGDISRFPSVASFWHYCGQHVVNGKAPKRQRGQHIDWNPEVRTTLWKTIDAALKNNIPTVRRMYEEFKAEELATHDEKCPNCKKKEGHCGARARRKTTKELLKLYYAAAGGTGKPKKAAA